MSAGQIQKPGAIVKENTSAVSQDSAEDVEIPEVTPKKAKSDKLDKVQKRAKGIKLTPIAVTANQEGWYGNRRIKAGDKFKLDDESDFSHNWMTKI